MATEGNAVQQPSIKAAVVSRVLCCGTLMAESTGGEFRPAAPQLHM